MARYARTERLALCDTFEQVGPDAPTLCEGWDTKALAAHLILRERRPDAAIGMFLAPLSGRTDKVQASLAARPWEEVIDTVRQGPPKWSPFALSSVDEAANLAEFYVHHEDVLRAQPGAGRRDLDEGLQQALWSALPRLARLTLRSVRVGVVASSDGFGRQQLHSPKGEHGNVVITGRPEELVLEIYGRRGAADVELDGADHDVQAYQESVAGV